MLALHAWSVAAGVDTLVHLENDCPLYTNLDEVFPIARAWGVGAWIPAFRRDFTMALANIVIVLKPQALERIARCAAGDIGVRSNSLGEVGCGESNEMQKLGNLLWNGAKVGVADEAPEGAVLALPLGGIPQGWPGVFDGAGFGQWLGGTDTVHGGTSVQGFCNKATYTPCETAAFQWEWVSVSTLAHIAPGSIPSNTTRNGMTTHRDLARISMQWRGPARYGTKAEYGRGYHPTNSSGWRTSLDVNHTVSLLAVHWHHK